MSAKWEVEGRSIPRLIKYINKFSGIAIVHSLAFLILYLVVLPHGYSCVMWGPDISYFSESLFPWRGMLFTRGETASQWMFLLVGSSLYVWSALFWGRQSAFGTDQHCNQALRIYSGLKTVANLDKTNSRLEHKYLNEWVSNSLGVHGIVDICGRHEKMKKRRVLVRLGCVVLFWLLQPMCALFLSLPSLGYTLSQNISSTGGILVLCNNSTVVVALEVCLSLLVLQKLTDALVRIRMSVEIQDDVEYNKKFTQTLFVIKVLSKVIWPVILTVILDESCAM